jgi:hypothetical protein
MLKTTLLLTILIALTSCTGKSTDKGKSVLEANRYSMIEPVGSGSGICTEAEQSKQEYTARSPQGDRVKMVVCEGFIKGEVIPE